MCLFLFQFKTQSAVTWLLAYCTPVVSAAAAANGAINGVWYVHCVRLQNIIVIVLHC